MARHCVRRVVCKGIQKGVALNELDKAFVIFKILDGNGTWLNMDDYKTVILSPLIRNIGEVPSYSFVLHKGDLDASLKAIDAVVQDIDQKCPFAWQLHGVAGHGEGLVLKPKGMHQSEHWWKAKGESHQRTRPPTLLSKAKVSNDKETAYAMKHVTYERLASAKEALHLNDADLTSLLKHLGKLIQWTIADIEREESFDGLDRQLTTRAITARLKELIKSV